MTWADVGAPRTPRYAIESAAGALHKSRASLRALLIEHLRDHPKKHGGQLECEVCTAALHAVRHAHDVLTGDFFWRYL